MSSYYLLEMLNQSLLNNIERDAGVRMRLLVRNSSSSSSSSSGNVTFVSVAQR